MFRFCRERSIPLVAAVNGIDRERADFDAAVASLEKMEANPVVVSFPIGSAHDVSGVVDVLQMKAYGAGGESEVPGALADAAAAAREKLVGERGRVRRRAAREVPRAGRARAGRGRARARAPERAAARSCRCFATAATRELGISRLLCARSRSCCPPPPSAPPSADAEGQPVPSEADAPFRALVLKTIIDRYAGTLSVLRVVSGTLQARVHRPRRHAPTTRSAWPS